MIQQSTNAVVMIRPACFYPNPETASDNAFQREVVTGDADSISKTAQEEFDRAVTKLREAGVTVHVFNDTTSPQKPDAVFPNNWFSTHDDGRIALYPMYSAARRPERRRDVIDQLRKHYVITDVVDYTPWERQKKFLEGTGSLVLDHANKIAFASLSQRTHPELLDQFCRDFGYEAVTFQSRSDDGRPVYHTNVMMCIGSDFVLVGLDAIASNAERSLVGKRLEAAGKEVINLSSSQIANFAGNAIELHNEKGKLLVLSERAASVLSDEQRARINRYTQVIELSLPTIELAGGSARCMIATIHLSPRI